MNKTMPAAVFEKEGVLALKNMPVPVIGKDDDVIIRVEAASICGSDLKILEVPPAHPGVEGVAVGLRPTVNHVVLGGRDCLEVPGVIPLHAAHEGDGQAAGESRVLAVRLVSPAPPRITKDVDVRCPVCQA